MHLQRLYIEKFRNLNKFTIEFDKFHDVEDKAGDPYPIQSHAVIGQNGSGKSNLIEVLVLIFRDLDFNDDASLSYKIEYEIRGHEIWIEAEKGQRPAVMIDGKTEYRYQPVNGRTLYEHADLFLPSHVFAYYSGKNSLRLEELFQRHIDRFRKKMESVEEEFLPAHIFDLDATAAAELIAEKEKEYKTKQKKLGKDLLRRLFYCRESHTQLVLLACLLSDDPVFKRILNDLNIVELDSALFVIKKPHRQKDLSENDILNGDERFWFSHGGIVEEFLDKLWQVAIAPIDHRKKKLIDFRGRREWQDQIYLYVPDKESLAELGEMVGDFRRFFRYAEGAYIGDFIDKVKITVKHKDTDGNITFDELSEGELQLLTVLGLMRLTNQDDCLFLLDEPDTHLNPIWKLRYFDEIEEAIQPVEGQTIAGHSQIIITTHDPMMVGSLRREQVRILRDERSLSLRNERGKTIVETPEEHPRGMGVSGLLKSELFGLRSTLDSETRRRLDRRNYLFALGDERSSQENEELTLLSEQLSDLGFSMDFRDPYFALFVQRMAKHTQFHKEILTPEEQKRQDEVADEIIAEILEEEKQ